MNMKEIKKLGDEEIQVESTRIRRKLFDLRSQSQSEKIQDSSQFRKNRCVLARMQTEASARAAGKNAK
ncbi:MAG: hypothetical protein EXS00_02565 [Phycisphaerales bacterium]|nr:hypothetical protein [Phycisphaerales bacterium]